MLYEANEIWSSAGVLRKESKSEKKTPLKSSSISLEHLSQRNNLKLAISLFLVPIRAYESLLTRSHNYTFPNTDMLLRQEGSRLPSHALYTPLSRHLNLNANGKAALSINKFPCCDLEDGPVGKNIC